MANLPQLKHISLGLSLGAIELGTLFSTLLYGTAFLQTCIYMTNYPHDRRWIKAVVGIVCSLETLHTICTWVYLYHLTVSNFGNAVALNDLPWYVRLTIPLQTFAGSIVQAFFSYRVHALTSKWWLAAPAYAALLLRAALGVAVYIFILRDKELSVFHAVHGLVGGVSWACSVASDMWNTALLCIHLRNRQSHFTETRNAVHRIIMSTIETGILTTVLGLLTVIFFIAMPTNAIWMCFNIIYPKLYPNSLLVSLNSRATLQDSISGVLATKTYDRHGARNVSKLPRTPDEEYSGGVRLQALQSTPERCYPFDGCK